MDFLVELSCINTSKSQIFEIQSLSLFSLEHDQPGCIYIKPGESFMHESFDELH
jgi:hypothetical protein